MTRKRPALARRLVKPQWLTHPVYVETYGPEVADIGAAAGMEPDPTQELLLDLTFAIDRRARPIAFEVVGIGPRQIMGKTAFIRMAELGWLYVTEERLIVHSAHELDTTEASFSELRTMIEDTPILSRKLDPSVGRDPGVTSGNGKWALQLVGGQKIKFKARTKTGGRGLTGSKTVLDEAFAVTPQMVGSLYPTMVTRPMAQVLAMSSACLPYSAYLRALRERGRAGDKRLVFMEYGDPSPEACEKSDCLHFVGTPGCRADDEDVWQEFMSGLSYGRAELDLLRDMRRSMPVEEWCREFMVWHDDPPNLGGGPIDPIRWGELKNAAAKQPRTAVAVLGVSPNRGRSTIAVAARGRKGRTLVMVLTGAGTEWVVKRLHRLVAKRDILEVALDPTTEASVLIPDLNAEGIAFHKLTSTEEGQARRRFARDVESTKKRRLEHIGQPELDAAVRNVRSKKTAKTEDWVPDDPAVDITPVRAAASAAYRWKLLDDYDVMDSIG